MTTEEKLEEKALELFEDGLSEREAMKILMNEFEELSRMTLIDAYKNAKNEVIANRINDTLGGMFAMRNNIEKEKNNKIEKSSLKVVKKSIEVEGEAGSYVIENRIVTYDEDKKFGDIEEAKKWARECVEKIEEEIQVLKNKLDKINKAEEELEEIFKNYM